MAIIARKPKREFTAAPEGLHHAVCCDVVDLGLQQSPWGQLHKVEIRWILDENDPKTSKPFMVVQRFTLSLHEKSKLRPLLEAWRGRKFTAEEVEGFDLEKLIGVNCQVQIIHNIRDDGEVFANVQAVVPAPKGVQKLRVNVDYVRVCERKKRAELERNGNGGYSAEASDVPF